MTKAETLQKYLPCNATYGDFDLCVECPYNPIHGKIWKYGCAHGQDKMIDDAISLLKEQQQIVRCKDCEHGKPCNDGEYYCEKDIGTIKSPVHCPDWFCAYGERK